MSKRFEAVWCYSSHASAFFWHTEPTLDETILEEEDEEEEFEEEATQATKTRKKSNREAKTKSKAKMSETEASKAKSTPKPEEEKENVSDADADLTPETGPVEYCYLSKPYTRMVKRGSDVNTHKFWALMVFNLTKSDNKLTKVKVVADKDKETGEVSQRIRITKPKFPSFMYDSKLGILCDELKMNQRLLLAWLKALSNIPTTID